jgi:hypothetical protein
MPYTTSSGREQKKNMISYIVNKATTETYVVIADTPQAAQKTVEQGQGELANLNTNYQVRPQPQMPQPVAPK